MKNSVFTLVTADVKGEIERKICKSSAKVSFLAVFGIWVSEVLKRFQLLLQNVHLYVNPLHFA